MKFKFDSYDHLPLNNAIEIHNVKIVIRAIHKIIRKFCKINIYMNYK